LRRLDFPFLVHHPRRRRASKTSQHFPVGQIDGAVGVKDSGFGDAASVSPELGGNGSTIVAGLTRSPQHAQMRKTLMFGVGVWPPSRDLVRSGATTVATRHRPYGERPCHVDAGPLPQSSFAMDQQWLRADRQLQGSEVPFIWRGSIATTVAESSMRGNSVQQASRRLKPGCELLTQLSKRILV